MKAKKVIAIYPGRFHPFHKGHYASYKQMVKEFGEANVFIASSDKVELPKSPFTFEEKKVMMQLAGVPSNKIIKVSNPYLVQELLAKMSKKDKEETAIVFGISEKDMAEDPRFNFAPLKSGKPGFYRPFKSREDMEPMGVQSETDLRPKVGYIYLTKTVSFSIMGKPAKSASEMRAQYAALSSHDEEARFIVELFGKYSTEVHSIMNRKLSPKMKKEEVEVASFSEAFGKKIRTGPNSSTAMRRISAFDKARTATGKKSIFAGKKEDDEAKTVVQVKKEEVELGEASSMSDSQIEVLRQSYGKLSKMDPSSPSYKKLTDLLDKLEYKELKKLSGAKINFVSNLALNRVIRADMAKKNGLKEEKMADTKKITAEFLTQNIMGPDEIVKKGNGFIARKGFFYKFGGNDEKFAKALIEQGKEIGLTFTVKNSGEVKKPFKGGAPVSRQSHWWVEFTVSGTPENIKEEKTAMIKEETTTKYLSEATLHLLSENEDQQNRLIQLVRTGLIPKSDVSKMVVALNAAQGDKNLTTNQKEMLISLLSKLSSFVTSDNSIFAKAKTASRTGAIGA